MCTITERERGGRWRERVREIGRERERRRGRERERVEPVIVGETGFLGIDREGGCPMS